jgi:hypothetical protein
MIVAQRLERAILLGSGRGCRRSIVALLIIWLLSVAFFAPQLVSQTVSGVVIETGSEEPITGTLIVALDRDGGVAAGTLTDDFGRFTIQLQAPGAYQLQVQRIGLQNTTTPLFQAGADDHIIRRIEATPAPVQLSGITAQAPRSACRIPREEALQLAVLWEESTKAMLAALFTSESRIYEFATEVYERDWDQQMAELLAEQVSIVHTRSNQPFRAATPDQLLSDGFVERTDSLTTYFGPDLQFLLSEGFQSAYCFRLSREVAADDPNLVGIHFSPANPSGPPAIEGDLRIDRNTFHLHSIDFRYVGLPFILGNTDSLGGRIDVESLASGGWIIRRWWIRMPTFYFADQRLQVMDGIREAGGEVTSIARSPSIPEP